MGFLPFNDNFAKLPCGPQELLWQLILKLEVKGAAETYGVYRTSKIIMIIIMGVQILFWIEEASRKILTHQQRPYPTLTTIMCNDSKFHSKTVKIL